MANETLTIKCADCGEVFDISVEEQKWYEDKGFQMPKRCVKCRKARQKKSRNRK